MSIQSHRNYEKSEVILNFVVLLNNCITYPLKLLVIKIKPEILR